MDILKIFFWHWRHVASSNTVLLWHLEKQDFETVNFFDESVDMKNLERPVIIVKTYQGSLSDERYAELNDFIERHEIKIKFNVGKDSFAWFKRKFDSGYPDYYAEILLIE